MKVLCRLAQVMACSLIVACLAPATFGAIEVRMASPTRGDVGTPINVDFFLVWDGTGLNTISSISFDVVTPAAISLPADAAPANPFNFTLASVNDVQTVAFTDLAGNKTLAAGENLFTTLTFQATAEGVFPVQLILVEAGRGGAVFFDDITATGEVTVSGGTIIVPEPSSLALLGLVSVGGFCLRRRR